MAKANKGKKKTVTIDYGKINRDRFQTARGMGLLLIIFSVVVVTQTGFTMENAKYIPVFLAGVACVIYGFWGMKQLKKAMEEQAKLPQNKTRDI